MPLVEVGPMRSPSAEYQIFEYEDEETGQSVFRVLGATAVWLGQFATAAEAVAFVEQRMAEEKRALQATEDDPEDDGTPPKPRGPRM